jgi:hypothetical protein
MEQAQWLAGKKYVLGDYSNFSFRKSMGVPGL